ncbi:polysaccharide biosynthesis protein, partial [Pseudomonadales bacterium]|nr:polysaccharide biosynthesis protein [Pseudomonadales bacterium]
ITITDPEMTRYLMSKSDAIGLVFEAVEKSIGGEIFVMRMPATSVEIMANSMIELFGDAHTRTKIIGSRPGEKVDEVLVSKNEAPFTKVVNEKYFVILPQKLSDELTARYRESEFIDTEEFNSRNADQLTASDLTLQLRNQTWLM